MKVEELYFEKEKKAGPVRPFPHEGRLQKRGEGENELVSAKARLDFMPYHYLPCFTFSSLSGWLTIPNSSCCSRSKSLYELIFFSNLS